MFHTGLSSEGAVIDTTYFYPSRMIDGLLVSLRGPLVALSDL